MLEFCFFTHLEEDDLDLYHHSSEQSLSLALEQKQVINEFCYKFNLVASKDTTFHVV